MLWVSPMRSLSILGLVCAAAVFCEKQGNCFVNDNEISNILNAENERYHNIMRYKSFLIFVSRGLCSSVSRNMSCVRETFEP